MKKWMSADVVELKISETAYGKNLNAREANANKGKKNNGAGGDLNIPVTDPIIPGEDDTVTPSDNLS